MSKHVEAVNTWGYRSPAGVTADPVLLAPSADGLSVLLVRRTDAPYRGRSALPGGFIPPTESPADTAQRKLTEKTGIGRVHLEQLATYGEPRRDPRGWILSVAFLALVADTVMREGETTARWHPVERLPALAFDHTRMVDDAVERLRGKLWYSNIAAALLPARFTADQARRVYEGILGARLDASNFRRSLEATGLVVRTDEVVREGRGRPATVYRFTSQAFGWSPRRSYAPALSPGSPA